MLVCFYLIFKTGVHLTKVVCNKNTTLRSERLHRMFSALSVTIYTYPVCQLSNLKS